MGLNYVLLSIPYDIGGGIWRFVWKHVFSVPKWGANFRTPGSSKSQEGSFAQLFFCGWETRVAQLAQPHPLSWHLTPFPVSNVQAVTSHNGNYSVSCAEHGDFYNTFQVCKGCWKACREGKHPKRKKTWVEDRDIYAKQPKTVGPYLDLSQMIVMSFNFP